MTREEATDIPDRRFLVTTAAGLQGLLAEELLEMGLEPTVAPSGVVVLTGGWDTAAKVLIRSRIASRLLLSLRSFSAGNQAMLYDQVRRVDWPGLFPPSRSIAVNAYGSPAGADYTLPYAALKIKDAVCDEFRKAGLPRPDVDRRNPDVRLAAFFFQGHGELSLDLSGEPLHRRGYREEGAEAPIRENRAAALLRFAAYDGSGPLVDPFCGSGTIGIEAAMMAARRAPGLLRPLPRFAAHNLFPGGAEALARERDLALAERRENARHPVRGFDLSGRSIDVAWSNARKAGVEGLVHFERRDALEVEMPGGWIAGNPPYGERLADRETAVHLVREFVHRVKHHGVGAKLALVLPRGDMEKAVGLRPSRRLAVESGRLGLRYLLFDVYAGSRKRP